MKHIQEVQSKINEWEKQAGLGKDLLDLESKVRDALAFIDELSEGQDHDFDLMHQLKARLFLLLSETYRQRGFLVEALLFSAEGLTEAEQSDNNSITSQILGAQGTSYRQLGELRKALQCYEQALSIDEQLENSKGIARHVGNIGIVYMDLKEYDVALEKYLKAIEVNMSIGSTYGAGTSWGNVGSVYYEQKKFHQSLESYTKAYEIHKEEGHDYAVALWLANIGNVLVDLQNFSEAKIKYEQSSLMYETLNIKEGIALNHINLGRLYFDASNPERDIEFAENQFNIALSMFEELHHATEIYKIHYYLSELFVQKGEWERAYEHHHTYHKLYIDVQNEDALYQAQKLEHQRKLESDQKDRELRIVRYQEQEKILHNMLPSRIAEQILDGKTTIAEKVDEVSIFFSDIVDFTQISEKLSPETLLEDLNTIFTKFDVIASKFGVEKIKTIGDSYMAACGVPTACSDHANRLAQFAFEIRDTANQLKLGDSIVRIRIGLHSGSAIAGVIGQHKYAYDVWGDAVNIASRMERHGIPGRIHVSEDFKNMLSDSEYEFEYRGEIEVKGKGKMNTYFMNDNVD